MAANKKSRPFFIADSCVGGLSVLRSLRNAGSVHDGVFLADYAINPLGVKSDTEIAAVVESWLAQAAEVSDTLLIACNTLSIRYRQLYRPDISHAGLTHVVSMVDCFEAMVQHEAEQLAGKNVLIVGTEFTASQELYSDILTLACPDSSVDTVAATDLERRIARFEPWGGASDAAFTPDLRQAIRHADVVLLACTCFPMVRADLEALFPSVLFLDPGAYCAGLMLERGESSGNSLSLRVTGHDVSSARVIEFAKSYLGVSKCYT